MNSGGGKLRFFCQTCAACLDSTRAKLYSYYKTSTAKGRQTHERKIQCKTPERVCAGREFAAIYPQVELAHQMLESKTGPGNDFLGWTDLPVAYDKEEFARIKAAAARIRSDSDVLVVIGIGGSYLGARAVIEAVKGAMYNCTVQDGPQIFFAGNSISPAYLQDILDCCRGKRVSVNIISKSAPPLSRPWRSVSSRNIWKTPWALKRPAAGSTPPPTVPAAL